MTLKIHFAPKTASSANKQAALSQLRQHVNPIDYKQKKRSHRQCQSSAANDYRFSSRLMLEQHENRRKKVLN